MSLNLENEKEINLNKLELKELKFNCSPFSN